MIIDVTFYIVIGLIVGIICGKLVWYALYFFMKPKSDLHSILRKKNKIIFIISISLLFIFHLNYYKTMYFTVFLIHTIVAVLILVSVLFFWWSIFRKSREALKKGFQIQFGIGSSFYDSLFCAIVVFLFSDELFFTFFRILDGPTDWWLNFLWTKLPIYVGIFVSTFTSVIICVRHSSKFYKHRLVSDNQINQSTSQIE